MPDQPWKNWRVTTKILGFLTLLSIGWAIYFLLIGQLLVTMFLALIWIFSGVMFGLCAAKDDANAKNAS